MKKITKFISILFIFMCVTGCKKTYLTCTKIVTEDSSIKVEETIKLSYKRKQLDTSSLYLDYSFKTNQSSNKESLRVELTKECERYKDVEGVKCSVYNVEDKIRLELSVTIDKISKEDEENFSEMLDYGNYTDSYRMLEKEYSCK